MSFSWFAGSSFVKSGLHQSEVQIYPLGSSPTCRDEERAGGDLAMGETGLSLAGLPFPGCIQTELTI